MARRDHPDRRQLGTRELELRFWIEDAQNGVHNVRSQVLYEIWRLFQQQGIRIPYPKRDLYATRSWRSRAASSIPSWIPRFDRRLLWHEPAVELPDFSVAVGKMAAAVRRTGGDQAYTRIRWEPDPPIQRIVSGWPQALAAHRAADPRLHRRQWHR